MLKWFIRSRLAAFQRDHDYNMDYAREILDADVAAFLKFAKAQGMGKYRKDVPKAVWYAAKLVGTLSEDCGPCTQLMVTLAERDGIDPVQVAAIVAGDDAVLTDEIRLGVLFARASLAHDIAADELRDEIVRRWGKKALVSIGFALVMARIYPTLKYALGHGKTCSRVVVAGKPIVPAAHKSVVAA